MHPIRTLFTAAAVTAPLVLAAGCETAAQANQQKENNLSAAGFIDKPADTAARRTMLAELPAHHFIRRTHGETVSYVYADPTGCNCLYVGSQEAYANYRRQQQRQNIADENALAASEYSNPTWDWGAWGPGFGPGWGWGPGFGW